jgi:thiamine-phosphate pyrophosphorylase
MLRYAITGGPDSLRDEAARIDYAINLAANGVSFLQLREKNMEAGALTTLCRQLHAILRAHHPACKLLINSRADIAVAIQADGVHLTSTAGSLTSSQIRELYGAANLPAPIVSVSCHTLAEVTRARDEVADLILFGPVFEKVVADKPISLGVGLDLLHSACALGAPVPILALGGVTSENTAACLAAGAEGIAAIRLFGSKPRI